ncbi:hypothetical protein H310_10069 [Aphanomyces invadans]|uniref:BART domain-containing protein n=1 Tax=Aphanomyces invadans TaxID=157072 RepID=A0A024TT00_9STRA|nr:hypothetical protein H310_10069 [Aphanomyces invadans]ETV96761.1 hypothetical protein H310_10069 [Aphanomyces invadans]|eukprot:XP_008874538.1 hypothetical protein H310_10069 [Aphanomyces invadans]
MNFQRLLEAARQDVDREAKQVKRPVKSQMVITKLLEYMLDMDEDGFEELWDFERRVIPYFEGHSTEYRLECKEAHAEFQDMVERRLERFLTTHGWTVDEFHRRIRDELAGIDSIEKEHEHAEELVRMIHDAFDFDSWAQSMRYSANRRVEVDADHVARK